MSLPPPLPASLPAGGEDHRLHPWSWLFVLLMQLRHYFLPLVALLVFGQRGERDPMWAQLIPLSAIAALVLVSVLQYLSYRYRIGSDAITVRSGLLARNRREIPFARIHTWKCGRTRCTGCSVWPSCAWNRPAACGRKPRCGY